MPIGSHHELTGRLNQGDGQVILRIDGGGTWRLELKPTPAVTELLGHRVRVREVREGFDLLVVSSLDPA